MAERSLMQPVREDMLHIDGLVQEKRNSIANALELRLSCTNSLICNSFSDLLRLCSAIERKMAQVPK